VICGAVSGDLVEPNQKIRHATRDESEKNDKQPHMLKICPSLGDPVRHQKQDAVRLESQASPESTHYIGWYCRDLLKEKYNTDGFSMGINVGEASGQTIGHVHIHLIPRRNGDMESPRGGVRQVIPEKGAY
jgi:hypothetical protein